MPRNMSFMLTPEQILNQTKTVTRRQGWSNLTPGTILQPVKKGMGLKKGEKVQRLGGPIRVVSVRRERIIDMRVGDVFLEGFPNYTVWDFIDMYCKANKCDKFDQCNRIEFEYCSPISSMIYSDDQRVQHFARCPSWRHSPAAECASNTVVFPENIPRFYNRQHALDEGWLYTENPKFADPEKGPAWVCPTCVTIHKSGS